MPTRDYQETLDFLYSQLPMYQRQGASAYKADLNNTIALCEFCGHPENTFKSVHIAGTNGKGTTAHTIASILQEAGYKTGLYTSPHLKDFRERIRIDGKMVPEEFVVNFTDQLETAINSIKPSFFEITVLMAFEHFKQEEVDIAIIETGMGGRLDSTNVITPLVSVITSIGYDHMQFLGETLEEIAGEKAEIIKPGVPVVLGDFGNQSVKEVFFRKAISVGSGINDLSSQYSFKTFDNEKLQVSGPTRLEAVEPAIKGKYYLKNLPIALEAISELKKQGFLISEKAIIQGLESVLENTGLKGRWQQLGNEPTIITDVGHNEDGLKFISTQLRTYKFNNLLLVLGTVSDKNLSKLFSFFPADAFYYFCQPDVPRGMPVEQLVKFGKDCNLRFKAFESVNEAIRSAKNEAEKDDLIFIGGSTFVVAEIEDL
jgi:dihydrofolate synthase/folylpolyglutamate synthase